MNEYPHLAYSYRRPYVRTIIPLDYRIREQGVYIFIIMFLGNLTRDHFVHLRTGSPVLLSVRMQGLSPALYKPCSPKPVHELPSERLTVSIKGFSTRSIFYAIIFEIIIDTSTMKAYYRGSF